MLRFIAIIILAFGIYTYHLDPPILLSLGADAVLIYLIWFFMGLQKQTNDRTLTKQERMMLFPGLVLYFPGSILLAYIILSPKHPKMLKDVWRYTKYAALLFFGLLAASIFVVTLISS